jgi:hypothetical protein
MEAYGEDMQAQYQLALWGAWHGEALHRVKKLPRLQEVLKPTQRTKARTPEEIDAILFRAAAAR